MKIVICPLSPGLFSRPELVTGATTHIIGFANALAARPHIEVRLLYPRLADATAFSRNVEILPLDVPGWLQRPSHVAVRLLLWNLFALYIGLRHILVGHLARRDLVEVLHIRFSASVVLPLLVLKFLLPSTLFIFEINTPASVSTANRGTIVRWLSRIIDKWTLAVCDGAFVVSEDLRTILAEEHGGWVQEKLFLNMNGVDPQRFRPLDDSRSIQSYRESVGMAADDLVLGYAGKPLAHHRLDLIARIVGEASDMRLKMAVAGNAEAIFRDELERLAKGKVVFLGQIPYERVPLFLNACDILVLPHGPSYAGLLHQSPIKLFEYMAVGKPIVASKIGQIERVITDNENGLLFTWDDDVELKDALLRLAKDAELRKELGQGARESVIRDYTWAHNARRVVKVAQHLRDRTS